MRSAIVILYMAFKRATFSAQDYWRTRNKNAGLKTVGLRSFSEAANSYMYRPLFEGLDQVMARLRLSHHAFILDAGAGLGPLTGYLYNKGNTQITSLEISFQ